MTNSTGQLSRNINYSLLSSPLHTHREMVTLLHIQTLAVATIQLWYLFASAFLGMWLQFEGNYYSNTAAS